MADSFAKKVRRNKPFRNAHGQYNFDGSINIGTDPVFDDKFMDRDLYSINLGSDVNEAILNEKEWQHDPTNIWDLLSSNITEDYPYGLLYHVKKTMKNTSDPEWKKALNLI